MQKCKNNNKTNLGEAEKKNKNKTGSQYIYMYIYIYIYIRIYKLQSAVIKYFCIEINFFFYLLSTFSFAMENNRDSRSYSYTE